jgi:hypothetical protein
MSAPELKLERLISWGFAPGSYACFCSECGKPHVADKRAWRCLDCAERRADLPPTDAEVLAHPKVRALVDAAEEQLDYLEMCGEDGDLVRNLRSAIAAIQEAKP